MTNSLLGRLRALTTASPYRAALIAAAITLALAAAACSGGDATATPRSVPPLSTATAPPPQPPPTSTPTPTPTEAAALTPGEDERLFIEIAEPADESVVSTGTVAVRGSTTADAVVSVNGVVVEVDAQGSFEAIVTLEEGPNLIEVVASDLTGAGESIDIVVVYIP